MKPRRYLTPHAFHTAVEARFRTAATESGLSIAKVRRQYLIQRFLARIYTTDQQKWILLGGTALLARIPNARHSRDIDFALAHPSEIASAVDELAQLINTDPAPDPFAFTITTKGAPRGDHISVKIVARLGVTEVDTFSVDITRRPGFDKLDRVLPAPVIVIDDVDDLPAFLTVTLAQQIADKLCAMYEVHGQAATPSSRYRDLVDLILIITTNEFRADDTAAALDTEQRRRHLPIPHELPTPKRQWHQGYAKLADGITPPHLNQLHTAMTHLRQFAAPLLDHSATGTWNPDNASWRD